MRPKYSTEAIVLGRSPLAEASATIALLTPDFGLVRARAQSVRSSGAKLAPAVPTLAECDAILVRGKEVWRLSGANLATNYARLLTPDARERAGRIARLMLRMMHGESSDSAPFYIFKRYLEALPTIQEEEGEVAEALAALRILRALGLDAGELPEGDGYDEAVLTTAHAQKRDLILRVNRGITASGL